MTEYLLTTGAGSLAGITGELALIGGIGLVAMATLFVQRRQKAVIGRLEEQVTRLTAGVSLLTNTTEDGMRSVALEIARLAGVATHPPKAPATARQRIAAAAGHGRSVQDIAAEEQVSEGEVLLHLLLDRLKPESPGPETC